MYNGDHQLAAKGKQLGDSTVSVIQQYMRKGDTS